MAGAWSFSCGSYKQPRLWFVSWLTPINFRCIWTLPLSLLWHPLLLGLTDFCLFFQPIGKWIPGWQLWFSFNKLGPSTAKACRKFSNSCFRDLRVKLMKEVVLLENTYKPRNYFLILSDLRTIFFHYGRKLIYALLSSWQNCVYTAKTLLKRSPCLLVFGLNLAWISLDMILHFHLQNLAEI